MMRDPSDHVKYHRVVCIDPDLEQVVLRDDDGADYTETVMMCRDCGGFVILGYQEAHERLCKP